MINENIWNIVSSIKIKCRDDSQNLNELDDLESRLNAKMKLRYSGFSGALVRIYDWLVRNNTAINEAENILQKRQVVLLKSQLQNQAARITELSQQTIPKNPKSAEAQQAQELVQMKQELIDRNSTIQQLKEVLKTNESVINELNKKLAEKIQAQSDEANLIKNILSSLGGVDIPEEVGEFNVSYKDNNFKIAIRVQYHNELVTRYHLSNNPFHVKTIIENNQLILKKYVFCSNKNIPKEGRYFCFENNSLFYCANGIKQGTGFDLTKPILVTELDRLYNSYSPPAEKMDEAFKDIFNEPEVGVDPTRTVLSKKLFTTIKRSDGTPAYENDKLVVNGVSWTPIDSSVAQACDGCFASMGSSPTREICTVDYKESLILQDVYKKLKEKIDTKHQELLQKEPYDLLGFEQFVLQTTLKEVQDVFSNTLNEEQIEKIVGEARDDSTKKNYVVHNTTQKIPLIPLDTFISKGIGICRHRAMLFLVLASQLKKEGLLLGEVRQVRDRVCGGTGAHSWNLYCSPISEPDPISLQLKDEPNVYLLDAMWNSFGLIEEGSSVPNGIHYLAKEKNLTEKLKKHIIGLKKSVRTYSDIGCILGVNPLHRDAATQKAREKKILLIRSSEKTTKDYVVEVSNQKNKPVFTIPKTAFSLELLAHLREAFSKAVDNDFTKKFVDAHLAKIGGAVRLLEEGRVVIYQGKEKGTVPFVR